MLGADLLGAGTFARLNPLPKKVDALGLRGFLLEGRFVPPDPKLVGEEGGFVVGRPKGLAHIDAEMMEYAGDRRGTGPIRSENGDAHGGSREWRKWGRRRIAAPEDRLLRRRRWAR